MYWKVKPNIKIFKGATKYYSIIIDLYKGSTLNLFFFSGHKSGSSVDLTRRTLGHVVCWWHYFDRWDAKEVKANSRSPERLFFRDVSQAQPVKSS